MSLTASINWLMDAQKPIAADHAVAIITSMDADAARRWWEATIVAHWPDDTRPPAKAFALPDVLGRSDVLDQVKTCEGAMLLIDPGEAESNVRALCGMLTEHAVPVVASLPASLAHLARVLQSGGIMVHLQGRGDAVLAALLAGTTQRQQAVREMEIELRSRRAAQKQVHSWVSKVDNELLLAAKLQRELMRVEEFQVPGLTTGIVYRPAWYVSGDVYRLVRLDEHHAGFLVADAMGHGISAAMYGMIIANGLTMKEVKAGSYKLLEPEAAMAKINGLLMNEDSDVTRFASAVCGRVDLRSGAMTLSSAGHPPVLIIGGSGGRVRRVDSTGPVLGVFADTEFSQVHSELRPGETAVVFTDGLEQIVGESAVEDYLVQTLEACNGDVKRAAESMERFLDARPGSLSPGDDVTILMIHRNSQPGQ